MYKITSEQRDTILALLDRVPIKGLKEVSIMVGIIEALSKKEEDKYGEQG